MSTVWLDERARVLIDAETRKCPRLETGGALFGYESHHELVVACAYGPGPRARHRRTSFEPNPRTTGALIRAVHEASDGRYRYLGSWHSHPNGRARPSAQDLATTEAVAGQADVALPSPLVLIAASRATRGQVALNELSAWRWSERWAWLLPCKVEEVRLESAPGWCRRGCPRSAGSDPGGRAST